MKIGFDNNKYIELQSEHIRQRIEQFGGKLYLEFGGKLFDDYHASRVLPGFEPDSKIRMLLNISSDCEIIMAIKADDIEKGRLRGDLGITYEEETLRLIKTFRSMNLYVSSVVITQYEGQKSVEAFRRRLSSIQIRSYLHYIIEGYPSEVHKIVSPVGYGKNDYIETSKPLVVVTAPGPGSGKMAVCLSQLYHEHMRGVKAGYAKFETFPIWNLSIGHPVNIAYEAATVDLDDKNMIDPYHMQEYGLSAVNYNRDIDVFPVLHEIMTEILGESPYHSPTDMGVNMAGYCIVDDDAVSEAAKLEILRRYFKTAIREKQKGGDGEMLRKMEYLMKKASVTEDLCPAIQACRQKQATCQLSSGAIVLPDGRVVTSRRSDFFRTPASLLLNALKELAGIPDEKKILSPDALGPILDMKLKYLHRNNPRMHADEVLIALSLSAREDKDAALALQQLPKLKGCDAHFTSIVPEGDERTYADLGIYATGDPVFTK